MKPTLILVDDVAETREELHVILQNDFEILGKASSVREGLLLARATGPDLILVDLILPEVSGFELIKQINEGPEPRPAIVVLSGTGTSECVSKALFLGAREFFVKPSRWDLGSQSKLRAVLLDALNDHKRTPK